MIHDNEIVSERKLEASMLIPILKQEIADTRKEARQWRHRCHLLELELLREGWTEDKLEWLYHNEQHHA